MKKIAILFIAVALSGCGGWYGGDADFVKSQSADYYTKRGFRVVGYRGYNMYMIGRCYWYTLEKNGTTFESCLMKWGDELHEYNLKAVDAIKGASGK